MRTQHPIASAPLNGSSLRIATMILALLASLLRPDPSRAQQHPAFTTAAFSATGAHRQNVCDRQELFHNGTVALRDALRGFELRPLLMLGGFFELNSDGAIDEKSPGLIAELLDVLAERGDFTWRDSFGVTPLELGEGQTYDELLQWSIKTYDVSVERWAKSVWRTNEGVSFLEGWYDSSIIMVGVEETRGSSLNFWSFLAPFDWGVWVMIVITIFTSGLVYWGLEWYNSDSDRQELEHMPTENIFLAALSFTGHFNFMPSTDFSRIFTLSLAFWALLCMSTYTANLASFLVVRNAPSLQIKTVGDAVRANLPICVIGSTVADVFVTNKFEGARVIRKKGEEDVYSGVRNGDCILAVVPISSWEEYERKRSMNWDCKMSHIGRVSKFAEGSFATFSDSGTLCTSLIRDVLNLHLLEMKEDGTIDKAWRRHLEMTADIDCSVGGSAESEDSGEQLSLKDMGGLFIIHFVFTAIAIFMAVFTKWYGNRKSRRDQRKELNKAIERSQHSVIQDGTDNCACEATDIKFVASSMTTNAIHQSQYKEMYEKQNQKLTALCEQMAEMMAFVNAIQQESDVL